MLRNWRIAVLLAIALTVLSAVALACGDGGGGSAEDKQAVEQTVRDVAGYGGDDVEAFLERVTDNFLATFSGLTREECRNNADDCVGDPADSVTLANTKIDGDTATTEGSFSSDGGSDEFAIHLVKEGGTWKIDAAGSVPREVPEGVKKVDLVAKEFSFEFDENDITDGNFAFVLKNEGEQRHEVRVAKIPEDLDLDEAIRSESEEEPEGVEDITFAGPFAPGEDGNVVFDQPLEPGRYALACFLLDTDPEKTPHALKGMYADFTVP